MKKMVSGIFCLLCAAALFSAPVAGAATFTVAGSDNPSAYMAYLVTDTEPYPQATPIPATYPAGPWVAGAWMTFDNPDQKWPMDSGSGNLAGTYKYLTTFDLTGLDPATAVLKISWASDNGSDLILNNQKIASTPSGDNSYRQWTTALISEWFIDDVNFLEFEVHNDQWGAPPGYINPTGILVRIDLATAEPVPEPSTCLLFAGGIAALGLARRRVRR